MNTADVMAVVTVLANFQIQILLDLQGYMEYGKQINTKCLSMGFRILTEYFFFSSVILCNAWYFVYVCEMIYVTLSLIQHGMRSHSISHISLQMQRKCNQKYSEDYKSNVASLQFTILSDGNSSDISITVFWEVASSRFTERGKSTEQTISQTIWLLFPLDEQQTKTPVIVCICPETSIEISVVLLRYVSCIINQKSSFITNLSCRWSGTKECSTTYGDAANKPEV